MTELLDEERSTELTSLTSDKETETSDDWGHPKGVPSPEYLVSIGHRPIPALKAIRLRCLDCCGEQPSEVAKCAFRKCANWPYRYGENPWKKRRTPTAEQLAALSGSKKSPVN